MMVFFPAGLISFNFCALLVSDWVFDVLSGLYSCDFVCWVDSFALVAHDAAWASN